MATEVPDNWSLFSDRTAVAEFIKDIQLVGDDEKQPLKDPFDGSITLSNTHGQEQILLFNKANNCNIVLTNKSIYCIFESDKVERIDLLNIVSINSSNHENNSIVSIIVFANSFNYSTYWKQLDNVDNFYELEFTLSGPNHSCSALYWEVIGNRSLTNVFKHLFTKNIIHHNNNTGSEFYQYHTFACKLSAHGIINNTLLLITNRKIYFMFVNCNKISKGISIKFVKWSFQISTLKCIIFDRIKIKDKEFMTILFHLNKKLQHTERLSLESKTDDYRILTSKSFKKFAFIDVKQHLKLNSILRCVYYDLMDSELLISIHLHNATSVNQSAMSGEMLKIRKLNPSKTAKKWIRFVRIPDCSFIEWCDSKESLDVDRLLVVGVSTDSKFLLEPLSYAQYDSYFAVICNERVVALICDNKQQKEKWIQFITDSGIPHMTIQDYNFYLYINNEAM